MRKFGVFALMIAFFYVQVGFGEENKARVRKGCSESENKVSCNTDNFFKVGRIEFGTAFGNYIGIRQGYAELGLFGMIKIPSESYLFLEGRGFLLSNNDWVGNMGFGIRKTFCLFSPVILGANIYYDYRSAHFTKEENCECCFLNSFRKSFASLGLGFEMLSEYMDFRSNIYLPMKEKQSSKSYFSYSNGHFSSLQTIRYIPYGIDAEIGKRLNFCSQFYATGAAGLYGYFYRNSKKVYGPFIRLKFGWGDYLSLQARYSYDNRFHSSLQGSLLFSLPFEQLAHCLNACCTICFDPMTQPVQRKYILFTEKKCCWKWSW